METTLEMVREIAEKHERTGYPELPSLPSHMRSVCIVLQGEGTFPPDMPKRVQKDIERALPIFGMTMRVYYPERISNMHNMNWDCTCLWGRHIDPLVIGEKDGKIYLVSAWE